MSGYKIFTDTASELSLERCMKLGILRLTLEVFFGSKKWLNHDDHAAFYEILDPENIPTTTGINYEEFNSAAIRTFEEGLDVIYIGLAGSLTPSSVNVCAMVQQELSEKYPERRIICLESRCVCGGLEYLVTEAVQKQQAGYSLDQLIQYINSIKANIAHHFTSDDLKFYHAGGRISLAERIAGSMLGIRPVMSFTDRDKLVNQDKARGSKAAIVTIAKKIATSIVNKNDGRIIISCANCPEKATLMKEQLLKFLPNAKIELGHIGPTIGAHAGPTTLAVFCEAEYR